MPIKIKTRESEKRRIEVLETNPRIDALLKEVLKPGSRSGLVIIKTDELLRERMLEPAATRNFGIIVIINPKELPERMLKDLARGRQLEDIVSELSKERAIEDIRRNGVSWDFGMD